MPSAFHALRLIRYFVALGLALLVSGFLSLTADAQANEWTWMGGSITADSGGVYGILGSPAPANDPGARSGALRWTDPKGNLWLFGGLGFDSAGNQRDLNDLWEFTPSSGEWTWIKGSDTLPSAGVAPGVYGTQGIASPGNTPSGRFGSVTWSDTSGNLWLYGGAFANPATTGYQSLIDLWKFDPSTAEWTWVSGPQTFDQNGVYGTQGAAAPANLPPGRTGAATWIDANGNVWLFGGCPQDYTCSLELGVNFYNDLWKFNPSTAQWTWINGSNNFNQLGTYGTMGTPAAGNVPGARANVVSWIDRKGNLWLFGGLGFASAGTAESLNDLWEYSPSTNQWTWANGPDATSQSGVPGIQGTPAPGNVPAYRHTSPTTWVDLKGNLWFFGGDQFNDTWEFRPSIGEWTWISGTSSENIAPSGFPSGVAGVYGTLQVPAAANTPGSRTGAFTWIDAEGNAWMFGGVGYDATGTQSSLNDLWEFNSSTYEWTWMAGSAIAYGTCFSEANWCGQIDTYGTLRTPGLGNAPSGRYVGANWSDNQGNLWVFGGLGYDGTGVSAYLNDLWEFQPNTNAPSVVATPVISPDSGTYTSWQTLTITDATPGSTISYLVNGVAPPSVYTGPVTISSSETINVIASASAYANSNIATASYVENLTQAATPTFSLTPGNYSTAQTVSISDTTPGATIYYAIGTSSATPSTLYSGPISVSSTQTIQAIAVASNYLSSAVATAAYNIGTNPPAEWTWMGGSSTVPNCGSGACGQPGWYGTLGTAAAANIPPARRSAVSCRQQWGFLALWGSRQPGLHGRPLEVQTLHWPMDVDGRKRLTHYQHLWRLRDSRYGCAWKYTGRPRGCRCMERQQRKPLALWRNWHRC